MMPPKRGTTRRCPAKEKENNEIYNEVPVKIQRRSVRKKTLSLQFSKHRNEHPEHEYDADSETELHNYRVDNNPSLSIDKETTSRVLRKKLTHKWPEKNVTTLYEQTDSDSCERNSPFKNKTVDKLMTKIMDCSVSIKHLSPNILSIDSSDSEKRSSDYCDVFKKPAGSQGECTRKNKENVTPPDSHSTPALLKLASRKLDTSLFGFDDISDTQKSQLSFSPVPGEVHNDTDISFRSLISTASTSSPFTSIASPSKRKREKELLCDVAIVPKKKQKKKKSNKANVEFEEAAARELEILRSQFEEVEMHQLIEEYD